MLDHETNFHIISFFETISKYYSCKTEITSGLTLHLGDDSAKDSSWILLEFDLLRSAYRVEGNKFMMEGEKVYYEISAQNIISFEQKGRNKYEFVEQYGESIFRVTKIRFHYKY